MAPCAVDDRVAVIVLCKDNPQELRETLTSILAQGLQQARVYVVDGSLQSRDCKQMAQELIPAHQLIYTCPTESGIFPAMNFALTQVQEPYLLFLNSGDCFWGTDSLARLVAAIRSHSEVPVAFGRALVEHCATGIAMQWPHPGVRQIHRWLLYHEPTHQAMLFRRDWAQSHPYSLLYPLSADREIKRAATREYVFVPDLVVRYRLGGTSSFTGSLQVLLRKLREVRNPYHGFKEVIKYCLERVMGAYWPYYKKVYYTLNSLQYR